MLKPIPRDKLARQVKNIFDAKSNGFVICTNFSSRKYHIFFNLKSGKGFTRYFCIADSRHYPIVSEHSRHFTSPTDAVRWLAAFLASCCCCNKGLIATVACHN